MSNHIGPVCSALVARRIATPPIIERTCDFVVSPKETAKIINVAVHTLRRLDKKGEGPERIQLSARRIGYRISSIERWLAERVCKTATVGDSAGRSGRSK
jgi:predicted DNA-binding transcriptional regulator AlpA